MKRERERDPDIYITSMPDNFAPRVAAHNKSMGRAATTLAAHIYWREHEQPTFDQEQFSAGEETPEVSRGKSPEESGDDPCSEFVVETQAQENTHDAAVTVFPVPEGRPWVRRKETPTGTDSKQIRIKFESNSIKFLCNLGGQVERKRGAAGPKSSPETPETHPEWNSENC